jgi:hypothetical protein
LRTDAAGRTLLFVSFVALLGSLWLLQWKRYLLLLKNPVFLCWTALVVFSLLNSMIKGYDDVWGFWHFVRYNYFQPYLFLAVILIEFAKNRTKCLYALLTGLLLYLILGAVHMTVGREGRIEAQELGNMLALNAATTIFVTCVSFNYNLLSKKFFYGMVAFCLFIIMMSATRKALGASVFLLAGFWISRNSDTSLKSFFQLALFALVAYFSLSYISENTLLGQRVSTEQTKTLSEMAGYKHMNAFLAVLTGDRALHYVMGFELFLKNFWTGIGIANFMKTTGFVVRLHTEYMVQLCENGIIGFSLLISVYVLLLRKLIRKILAGQRMVIMGLSGLFALLFLNITAWTYNLLFAMIFYALIIDYAYHKERNLRMWNRAELLEAVRRLLSKDTTRKPLKELTKKKSV